MKQYVVLVFLFVFSTVQSYAQQERVGDWIDYLPYGNLNKIVETERFVYAASDFSLLEWSKEDNALTRLSKVRGLNDIGITALGYHQPTNTTIIGYENGNIDFIKEGVVEGFG